MISLDDCIQLCGLTRAEVDAIAEHEHIDEIDAAALADYLLGKDGGPQEVCQMIRDDLRLAIEHGRKDHARELVATLRHFIHAHPESV